MFLGTAHLQGAPCLSPFLQSSTMQIFLATLPRALRVRRLCVEQGRARRGSLSEHYPQVLRILSLSRSQERAAEFLRHLLRWPVSCASPLWLAARRGQRDLA